MSYYTWLPAWAWVLILFAGIGAMLWLNARPPAWWGEREEEESSRVR
jgi:hypothetical protein